MPHSARNTTPHPDAPSPAPPRLFGQYLVDHGVVDAAALEEALDLMRLVNRTVGQLATARGLCTPEEAERVAELQREIDEPWGEIALAAGVGRLMPGHLEALLAEQSVNNLRLSDALVELGHASASEIDEWWARYETEVGRADALGSLPEAYRRSPIVRDIVRVLPRVATRVLGRAMLLGASRPWTGTSDSTNAATIEIRGESPLRLGMVADDPRRLSKSQIVALLETAAWHATRRAEEASRICDPPETSVIPDAGVAIDLALGNASCTLVLTLDPPTDTPCH